MTSVRKLAKRVLPARVVQWLRELRAAAAGKEGSSRGSGAAFRKSEPTVDHVIGLEVMLFSTGDQLYAEKLANSVRSATRGSDAQIRGSLALARWNHYRARPRDALRHLDEVVSSEALQTSVELLRIDCLCELGDGQAALSLLSKMIGRQTDDQNLALRVGHARSVLNGPGDHGSGPVIEALNTIYRHSGFGMLRRTSLVARIGLDNISCEVPDTEPRESLPRVTVITWLRDPFADMMGISSLLGQSWRNLEVLVVADVGGDDRVSTFDPNLFDDDRVVFVEGSPARDLPLRSGLDRATGELITTHPPGSWAHPQRVEAQASALLVDSGLRGTISSHMHVAEGLIPRPLGLIPKEDMVGPNPRSAMLRISGSSRDRLLAEFDQVTAGYSPIAGELRLPGGIELVSPRVPMTLSTERHASVESKPEVTSS